MMFLRIYGVVLRVVVGGVEGVMLLVFFVVAVRVVDVLDGVLLIKVSAGSNSNSHQSLTVGCACNLSLGV